MVVGTSFHILSNSSQRCHLALFGRHTTALLCDVCVCVCLNVCIPARAWLIKRTCSLLCECAKAFVVWPSITIPGFKTQIQTRTLTSLDAPPELEGCPAGDCSPFVPSDLPSPSALTAPALSAPSCPCECVCVQFRHAVVLCSCMVMWEQQIHCHTR